MHSNITLVPTSLTLNILDKANRFQASPWQGLSKHLMMNMLVEGYTGTRQKILARKPSGGFGVWLSSNCFVAGVSSQHMGETGEKQDSTQLNNLPSKPWRKGYWPSGGRNRLVNISNYRQTAHTKCHRKGQLAEMIRSHISIELNNYSDLHKSI